MEQSSSDGCYEMNTEVMSICSDKASSCGALIINMTELKDRGLSSPYSEAMGNPKDSLESASAQEGATEGVKSRAPK
ncbi:uncharacterized [Tachysurus ichikawai]